MLIITLILTEKPSCMFCLSLFETFIGVLVRFWSIRMSVIQDFLQEVQKTYVRLCNI